MDVEGVDVHFMVGGAAFGPPGSAVEFLRAGHRFLDDFCSADLHRLKAGFTVIPGAVEESVEEIKRGGRAPGASPFSPPCRSTTRSTTPI